MRSTLLTVGASYQQEMISLYHEWEKVRVRRGCIRIYANTIVAHRRFILYPSLPKKGCS